RAAEARAGPGGVAGARGGRRRPRGREGRGPRAAGGVVPRIFDHYLRAWRSSMLGTGSPGVGLRRLAPGAGPDAVEARELLGGERDLERPEAPGHLFHRARSDDRRRDGGVGEQPGERDVGGRLAELAAEALVRLELRAIPLDALPEPLARAATLLRLLERAAEQAAPERAPRDDPDAVRAA